MKRNNWQRAIGAIAVSVALGLALSGCIATVGNIAVHVAANAKNNAPNIGKPRSGSCWHASYKEVDGYANWGHYAPASACTLPHQLYTFAVPKLEGVHKGKLFDKQNYAYSAIENDAYQSCSDAENVELDSLGVSNERVIVEDYLPEEDQWNQGARWVRCDIGVIKVGSFIDHPQFEDLPSITALNSAMSHSPEQFDFCINSTGGGVGEGGPKAGGEAVFADCTKNPEWKLHDYQDIVTGTGDSIPTMAEMQAQYQLSCEKPYTDATHITYAYYPSKSDWKNGDKQLECWIGRLQ